MWVGEDYKVELNGLKRNLKDVDDFSHVIIALSER